jgi:hypothetical protein
VQCSLLAEEPVQVGCDMDKTHDYVMLLLFKNIKIKIYKTIILPVFEIRLLWKIFGA